MQRSKRQSQHEYKIYVYVFIAPSTIYGGFTLQTGTQPNSQMVKLRELGDVKSLSQPPNILSLPSPVMQLQPQGPEGLAARGRGGGCLGKVPV